MPLPGRKTSMFIISSHIVEAGEKLKQRNKYRVLLPAHTHEWSPARIYLYLEQGITDDRHGMIIIRNEGILETLKNGHRNIRHLLKDKCNKHEL